MHSMQNPFKIILSILGLLLFFSCEQHYYFLNKVKVNTDEISLKTVNRLPQQPLNISINADSNDIVNNNTIAQKELSKNGFHVNTPKAISIKKYPDNDAKIKKIKNGKTTNGDGDTNDNLTKIIIGILFIVIGVILLLIGVLIFLTSEGSSYGCSPILSIIFGIISLIFGLGLAFINY
jgi:hypothetical protein